MDRVRDQSDDVAFTDCGSACSGEIKGAKYQILLPEKWNGSLLLYSHGYRSASPRPPDFTEVSTAAEPAPGYSDGEERLADALLAQGYALAGSSWASNGWAVSDGVAAASDLYQYFRGSVAEPNRVYVWGDSLGGLVTKEIAEQHPDWVDGAAPLCGAHAGVVPNMDLALDLAWGVRRLLDPSFTITDYDSVDQANKEWEKASKAVIAAAGDVEGGGSAKVLALGALVDAAPQTKTYDGGDAVARVKATAEAVVTGLGFGTFGRYDVEQRFGGQISDNTETDYASRFSEEDRALIDTVGGSGATDAILEDLDRGKRIAADDAAVAKALAEGGDPADDVAVPTLTLHTAADPLVIVQNQSFLKERTGGSEKLVQLFTVPPADYPEDPGAPVRRRALQLHPRVTARDGDVARRVGARWRVPVSEPGPGGVRIGQRVRRAVPAGSLARGARGGVSDAGAAPSDSGVDSLSGPGLTATPRSGGVLVLGWAVVLTVAVMGPLWTGRGFALSYDMVAVPHQTLLPWMWGGSQAPPRAVPQDVYIALLDDVLPGDLLQKVLLTGLVLGALGGVALLMRPLGRAGQVAAMSAYCWSAYFYERLVIGHWGLLLAYAALPWVVLAARAQRAGNRRAGGALVVVVLLGTWVPTGGLLLAVLACAIVLWPGGSARPAARVLTVLGVLAVQASWVVPAVLTAGSAAPSGGVFGLRADGVVRAVVVALGGSGIWSPSASPASRQGLLGALAAGVLLTLIVIGMRPAARMLGRGVVRPLALVSIAGVAWAVLTAVPAAAGIVAAVESLPGGGLLRDAQKWLAPWWLLASLAFGAAAQAAHDRLGRDRALQSLTYAIAVVPLVLLPDLAWGALGRIEPVAYPQDWADVASALDSEPDGTAVVSLPWGAFRKYAWNGDRVVLDPAPRFFSREVLTDSALLVGGEADVRVVPGDDPRSLAVEEALRAPDPASALRALGVGWVLVETDQPPGRSPGDVARLRKDATVRVDGASLELLQLTGEVSGAAPATGGPAIATAWLLALAAAALGAVAALRPRGPAPSRVNTG